MVCAEQMATPEPGPALHRMTGRDIRFVGKVALIWFWTHWPEALALRLYCFHWCYIAGAWQTVSDLRF